MTIKDLIELSHRKEFYQFPNGIVQKMIESDFTRNEISYFMDLITTQKLALISSESSEAIESLRHEKRSKLTKDQIKFLDKLIADDNKEIYLEVFESWVKDSFEDEVADIWIRLADLSGREKINIEDHIKYKGFYNKFKGYLNGKRF